MVFGAVFGPHYVWVDGEPLCGAGLPSSEGVEVCVRVLTISGCGSCGGSVGCDDPLAFKTTLGAKVATGVGRNVE